MIKKMVTENLWLKVISVILAAILWVLILYTYDPAATADFTLNVNVINGDTITSLGKVYEVMEGNTVTIRVKANSSLVKTLRTSDFEATADVSKLSLTSHANIDVVCTRANNVDIRLIGDVKFLEVKLEDLITKQFPITVDKKGEAEEGFFIGNAVPKPNFITVSGGKSSVNKIKAVKVRVNANKSQESFVETASPKAYDTDGNEITTGSLKFSDSSVSVFLNIYKTKNVPINIKTVGLPYSGYGVEDINYEPKLIKVAGEDDKLSGVNKIVLPVDVEGEITSVESSVRMSDFMSEGLYLVDPETVVNINAIITRFTSKDFSIPLEKINLVNQKEEFEYELLTEESLKVTLKGLKVNLDKLPLDPIEAEINLEEITEEGEYSLPLTFKEIKDITFPETSTINCLVKKKGESEEEIPSTEKIEEVPSNEENNNTEGNEGRE